MPCHAHLIVPQPALNFCLFAILCGTQTAVSYFCALLIYYLTEMFIKKDVPVHQHLRNIAKAFSFATVSH
jgi:hypothetical protein